MYVRYRYQAFPEQDFTRKLFLMKEPKSILLPCQALIAEGRLLKKMMPFTTTAMKAQHICCIISFWFRSAIRMFMILTISHLKQLMSVYKPLK